MTFFLESKLTRESCAACTSHHFAILYATQFLNGQFVLGSAKLDLPQKNERHCKGTKQNHIGGWANGA